MSSPANPRMKTLRAHVTTHSRCVIQLSPRLVASRMNASKGGLKKLEKHGVEAFQKMGEAGGARMVEKYSKDFFQVIGTIGGQKTREKHQKNRTQGLA